MHATEFVSSYFEAWNKQDSKAIADHLIENGSYLDMAFHLDLTPAQLIEDLDEQFELEKNRYELFGEVLASNNTIAFQYKVTPSDNGSELEAGSIWYGAEFVTLCEAGAVKIADYYDVHDADSPGSPLAQTNAALEVNRYAKSGLSASQLEALKNRLNEVMRTDKVYLRPDISLPSLAESLACSVNHVSQAINAGFGVTFFDYINEHRVKDAMVLLLRGDARTVLDVALEVGFRSTSTFYIAFRKVTKQTPAQFRKAHQQNKIQS